MKILIMANAVMSIIIWVVALFGAKNLESRVSYYSTSILLLLWAVALLMVTTLGGLL